MLEFLIPIVSFALAASVTPGPNTIMVTASGANYGFARTNPHILGVTFGFPVMIVAVGPFGRTLPDCTMYMVVPRSPSVKMRS